LTIAKEAFIKMKAFFFLFNYLHLIRIFIA